MSIARDITVDAFSAGQAPTGAGGYEAVINNAEGSSLVSTSNSISAPNSTEFTINVGQQNWGAQIRNVIGQGASSGTQDFQEGDEIWCRFGIFHPSNWDNTMSAASGSKFFRMRTEVQFAVPRATCTWQLLSNGSAIDAMRTEREGLGAAGQDDVDILDPAFGGFTLNAINFFEFYVRYSRTTNGIVRGWCNNLLAGELTGLETAGDDFVNLWYHREMLLNFYNDGAPQTQSVFVDNYRTRSSRLTPPTNTDASGNLFIGDVEGLGGGGNPIGNVGGGLSRMNPTGRISAGWRRNFRGNIIRIKP